MATIPAADVKRLRDATGAGMLDSKNALVEADGDFEKAIEVLRVKGQDKVKKRGAERTASAGLVVNSGGALVELNSETDFVAKSDSFISLANEIVTAAEQSKAADAQTLAGVTLPSGKTVAGAIESLASVIGEKLELGRVTYFDGNVVTYMHRRSSDLPHAIGVLVAYEGDNTEAARGVAQQIAAMRPQFVTRAEVPEEVVAKEREIAEATAREEGKPEQALPRIIEGRLNGYFKDVVLLEQPAVQDSKRSVKALLDEAGVSVSRFARFEVGVS
ncbi:MAG: elongation factor Ts [Nocardioidaceae bacterium]|jgi:elongation factor Ts|nr:elongation factor Ts [Nocardioidaceae bacterium]MDX6308848.1 elongation factor Ts [Nocardioidaceae bacterium]